jgi:hypothetical protein
MPETDTQLIEHALKAAALVSLNHRELSGSSTTIMCTN